MRDMRLLVRRLADEGMTVLLSSHLMNEVEELCNRVAIVRSGAIVYEGELAELKRTAARLVPPAHDRQRARARALRRRPGVKDARRDGDAIRFAASEEAVAELSRALVEADALILRADARDGDARGPLLLAHRGPAPSPQPRRGAVAA